MKSEIDNGTVSLWYSPFLAAPQFASFVDHHVVRSDKST